MLPLALWVSVENDAPRYSAVFYPHSAAEVWLIPSADRHKVILSPNRSNLPEVE